jgi:hypothetical protein
MTDLNKKNDGGPAFPVHGGAHEDDDPRNHTLGGGMSLRDFFAGQALVSMETWVPSRDDGTYPSDRSEVLALKAAWAYDMADAMLAARSK